MNKNNISKIKERKVYNDPLIVGLFAGMIIAFVIMVVMPSNILSYDFINKTQMMHVFKIIFAAVSGGIIGFEREHKNRPAGLRTHALVSIGAAMVMLIPIELAYEGTDPMRMDVTRLGAQVISGIGFLGAGTIIRNGESVKGLTTAASLWVSAIIGLTIGAGNYMTSFVSLLIVIFILKVFGSLEHRQGLKFREIALDVTMDDLPQQISLLNNTIDSLELKLQKMEVVENSSKVKKNGRAIIQIRLFVRCDTNIDEELILNQIKNLPGVIKVNSGDVGHFI